MVHSLRRALPAGSLLAAVVLAVGCGPSYLTPDLVREHLEAPRGSVSQDTMPRAARGFFRAKTASQAQAQAFFLKSTGSGDGVAGWAQGIVDQGAMEQVVAAGAAESAADVFCAASLVANVAAFDECERGEDCEVDLTIDSCVMRLGENGDERARGSIKFKLKNSTSPEFDRTELRITFDAFESTSASDEAAVDRLAGIVALEETEYRGEDVEKIEVIVSADIDVQLRKVEPAFLEDPILQRQRATAALRFSAEETATSAQGRLEILCFVDESDDARDESISIVLAAESHQLDPSTELASATLEVNGTNGNFTCTWSAAERDLGPEGERYESNGECVDEDTGETFSFASVLEET